MRLRLVVLLAPVAVSVRRSPAASLRMRLTLMANTPRASAIPNTVAQLMMSDEDGASFFDSTVIPDAAATCRASSICAAVNGLDDWSSQPWTHAALQVKLRDGVLGDHRVGRGRSRGECADLLDIRVGQT